MATITVEVSDEIKNSLGLGQTITIKSFIKKISLSSDIVFPDLQELTFDELSDIQKEKYLEAKKIPDSHFVNL